MRTPVVGLIVPPTRGTVPPEASELYPEVKFLADGLGLQEMTPPEFTRALEHLPASVTRLRARGAEAVCLMGTSISFYRGETGHDEILARMRASARGAPVSTMTNAVVHGLRSHGLRAIVVATAYAPTVANALTTYLDTAGFEVLDARHLNLRDLAALDTVTTADLEAMGRDLLRANPTAEGLLFSCGGLRTIAVTESLEREFAKPVISSAVAGCHHAVALSRTATAGD